MRGSASSHILSELLHIIATMSNDFACLEKCLLDCR